nr:MAG TPA: hypothetical protein [Caudoviricetes sp.]
MCRLITYPRFTNLPLRKKYKKERSVTYNSN